MPTIKNAPGLVFIKVYKKSDDALSVSPIKSKIYCL